MAQLAGMHDSKLMDRHKLYWASCRFGNPLDTQSNRFVWDYWYDKPLCCTLPVTLEGI